MNKWIPFKLRETTQEEREVFGEESYMLVGNLPDDEEEILVSLVGGHVILDVFMRDGSLCYLDSGMGFVTDAIAWMPLPEPYVLPKPKKEKIHS